ncbi:hypothetical protein SEVIR_4G204701v4 [Setaria viridis]
MWIFLCASLGPATDAATLAPYKASFLFRCFFPFKMFFMFSLTSCSHLTDCTAPVPGSIL